MNLSDLHPAAGSTKRRKVIGRGTGSGHGGTSTRGHKGDKARGQSKLGFEGGQTPFHRRMPKQRGLAGQGGRVGHKPIKRAEYAIVNLGTLERFEAGTEVTPELLVATRVIKTIQDGVKVLGGGNLTKQLTVRAHHFSQSAQDRIAALGGTAETL
jgi:large subunit ribosomal protein L15